MEKPPVEPSLPPQERDDVKLAVSRCPYCRDDVAAEGSAVCEGCLARHHPACWDEAGACSACGSASRLERAQRRPMGGRVHDPEWDTPPPAPVECAWVGCERPNTWAVGDEGLARWCEAHARQTAANGVLLRLVVSAVLAVPGVFLLMIGYMDQAISLAVLGVAWLGALAYVVWRGLRDGPRERTP